ncbi:hypothetical protein [Magnetospirillum aberrantis]|uniref:Uncharacterized protein n=1 Tax=Magnetospirillum aberrantis SpK TaxID=908842 RepID=A0A7C9QSI0_9PROT|nr:hypothetical protein [Magnetospirillum aberrantis]NFV79139.1 hypothetical protein [Magnetospirillum aberrantis SpK]
MDGILSVMAELLSLFYDVWRGGRVSRGFLLALMAGALVSPVAAVVMEPFPVVQALLFGATAVIWVVFLAVLAVGCRRHEKKPREETSRGQFDHSASDD